MSTENQYKMGPLEKMQRGGGMKDICEMCGSKKHLEPAFDPSWHPKTLCRDCRIGCAELLADARLRKTHERIG